MEVSKKNIGSNAYMYMKINTNIYNALIQTWCMSSRGDCEDKYVCRWHTTTNYHNIAYHIFIRTTNLKDPLYSTQMYVRHILVSEHTHIVPVCRKSTICNLCKQARLY